jgi:DNA-binding MarR family transcriptional regulator
MERLPGVDPEAIDVYLAFLLLARELTGALALQLAHYDLSEGKFAILMLLRAAAGEAMMPSELAEQARVTRATITGLLDGLSRSGLIARRASPEDGRRFGVVMTTKGRAHLDAMLPTHFARVTSLMSHLSGVDRRQLARLLAKLYRGIPAFRE